MKRIFLGPVAHWIVLLAAVAAGWFAGDARLHVTHFNLFLVLLIAGTVLGLFLLLAFSRDGARITRDPIEEPEAEADRPAARTGEGQAGP